MQDSSAYAESDMHDLKRKLLSILARCDRGFKTTAEDKESVMRIVRELEQINPTPNPNATPLLLTGTYQLLFTDASNVLDIAKAPGVVVGEMLQKIACAGESVDVITTVNLEVPIRSKLEVNIDARGRLVGDGRIALEFDQTSIQPTSLLGTETNALLPALKIPMQPPELLSSLAGGTAEFILHTFLDEELRIARRGKPADLNSEHFISDLFISSRISGLN